MTHLSIATVTDALEVAVLPEPKYPRFVIIESSLLYLPNDGTDWKSICAMGYDFYNRSLLPIRTFVIDSPARIALFAFDSQPTEYKEKNKKWHQRLREVDGYGFASWSADQ